MDKKILLLVAIVLAVCAPCNSFKGTRLNPDLFKFHKDNGIFTPNLLQKPEHDDRGYIKNCGPEGGFFNISWSPKEIDPTRQIYLYGDVVSPIDFDVGKANGSMWYMGQPMVTVSQLVKCTDALSFLPEHATDFKCPLKKGQRFRVFYVFPNTERLIGYDGDYKLKAELMNMKGEQLLCFEIDVTVKPFA